MRKVAPEIREQVVPIQSQEPDAHPVSLEAFSQKEFDGRDLTLGKILEENSAYTRHYITYKSGELTISGILNIPKGEVPEGGFPVLLLNHGYIDPAIYTNGRGLRREQDFLARQGFAVLHSDYRNHADSDIDPNTDVNFRLGYAEDVANAVYAVQNSQLPSLSKTRFGMLGHSMGGGVAQVLMTSHPDLFQAVVLYAPVSSDARDNFDRWTKRRFEVASRIEALYGPPETNADFWDGISPLGYFDRVTAPVLIFHGTRDESCDIGWSRTTLKALQEAGARAELVEYSGEAHEFGPKHSDFMQRSAEFFRREMVKQ